MRLRWLLPSVLGLFIFLLSAPVLAARLIFWRFETSQNRLVFTTDAGVQPKAQLIANPTRLVIDLPGITLGRPTSEQAIGGAIRAVRAGQFDSGTARLVVELNPGYTLDPSKIQFRGISPTQWTVQLPTPEREAANSSGLSPTPVALPPALPPRSLPPTSTTVAGGLQLESFQVTSSGFFIRSSGGQPNDIKVNRSGDRRTIDIDVAGGTVSSRLSGLAIPVNRYGVATARFSQVQASPPVARVSLTVDRDAPDWSALYNATGAVVVLPQGVTTSQLDSRYPSSSQLPISPRPPVTGLAVIQSVELTNGGSQLLIRADRGVRATSNFNRTTGNFLITIPGAQLAEQIRGPRLEAGGAIARLNLRQQDARTVVILVQPAPGVQIGQLNQPSDQFLALSLQRPGGTAPVLGSIPVPTPDRGNPTPNLPRVPNSRMVVIIDPGHGGKDPGAIGLGGIREKDIVMSISQQVASFLEGQGVQARMTRSTDDFVSLEGRVQLAAQVGADLFISIHANSLGGGRTDVSGLETYYYSSGQRLAQTVHNSILQSLDIGNRGVRQARFYVLRNSAMPSILVETGFVTGREDARKLTDPNYQTQMARAIANGVLQYIQQNF